jgi:dethiobiotin synthetase
VVEGVGGWLVPLRRDAFVSDLARAMQLPVVVVAMNRLGCLNHAMLTVESIAANGSKCRGVVLNTRAGAADFSSATNHKILSQIAEVRIVSGLSDQSMELAAEWRQMLELC